MLTSQVRQPIQPPCLPRDQTEQARDGVVEPIDHPLLQRDDRIVGDVDVLRAHLRAALRDVAVAEAVRVLQITQPVACVERVHLERGRVHEEPRADELVVLPVIAQHVAHVLAEEALDALAELLHAIDVPLRHAPRPVGRVGRARREPADARLHGVVPRHVGDEVLDERERPHRLHGDRLVERQGVEPGHAHEARPPVDLGRAGPAFPRLAVPAARQVGRLLRLDAVHGVEHDHALGDLGAVVLEAARPTRIASPDSECRVGHYRLPLTVRPFTAGHPPVGGQMVHPHPAFDVVRHPASCLRVSSPAETRPTSRSERRDNGDGEQS